MASRYTHLTFDVMINQPSMLQFRLVRRLCLLRLAAFFRGTCVVLLISLPTGVSSAPGQLDATFANTGTLVPINLGGGISTGGNGGMLALADGSTFFVGGCAVGSADNAHGVFCVTRLTPNGQVDSTFGNSGIATATFPGGTAGTFLNAGATQIVRQPDGKLVVAGRCSADVFTPYLCFARFLTNGSLDTTFNSAGPNPGTLSIVHWGVFSAATYTFPMALQSNGKLVIGFQCDSGPHMCLMRLAANGTWDVTFAGAATGSPRPMPFGPSDVIRVTSWPNRVTVDSSDRIVVVGTCQTAYLNTTYPCIGRLNANGSSDPTFVNPDTSATSYGSWFGITYYPGGNGAGNDVAVQSDGKLLFIGDCGNSPGTSTCITRLLPGGAPDITFNNGDSTIPGTVRISMPDGFRASRTIAIQPNRKIVFAGDCSYLFSFFCIGRLNTNNQLDTTFDESPGNGNGIVQLAIGNVAGYATDVAIDGTSRIVLRGLCSQPSGYLGCAARLIGGERDVASCALNADANSAIESSTDALLILRYLLGYRGDALTNGALGISQTRTGAALEAYLASLNLDADGDGQAHAMTDGLLILRAMLGLSGNALTAGAVNTSSPSARNAQQILTWIESTHGVACLP